MKQAVGKSLFFLAAAGTAAVSLVASAIFLSTNPETLAVSTRPGPGAVEKAVKQAFLSLPLAFEPNKGQSDAQVNFLARGPGYTTFLSPRGATLSLGGNSSQSSLQMQLIGSNPDARPAGVSQLPGKVNYLTGPAANWIKGLPTFSKVRYSNVYPGIDLVYYGNQRNLEYDFIVKPGADPSTPKVRFEGADNLALRRNGDLVATVEGIDLVQRKPHIYQNGPAGKTVIPGSFSLRGDTVGFRVGAYDPARTLVIDPVISYASFVGGTGTDVGFGVAADSAGNAYLTGSTTSSNFPAKGGVTCGTATSSLLCKNSLLDAYVTKVDTNGIGAPSLVWSTYLGGDNDDVGFDVTPDADGNVYVAGSTQSSDDAGTVAVEDGFPTTANAFDASCGTDGRCNALPALGPACPPLGPGPCPTSPIPDAFMAKLSPSGDALLYSTFLGGSDFEQESNPAAGALGHMDIAVRGSVAYVGSTTASSDFPTTLTGDKTCGSGICNGRTDAFVSAVDTAKSGLGSLVFSTYLGGDGTDSGKGIALDADGDVYVAGTTVGFNQNPLDPSSPVVNNFPDTTGKGYQGGNSDGFVAKILTSGLIADADVKVKLNGGGLQPSAKANVGNLLYSTYLGGGATDEIWDVAVNGKNAYVTGFTDSGDDPSTPAPDGATPYFPTTAGAYDTSFNGQSTLPAGTNSFLNGDAFVSKLKEKGDGLIYSTYLGGIHGDVGHGIVVDSAGAAYVTGYTMCKNQTPGSLVCDEPLYPYGSFPVVNAVQPNMGSKFLGPELHNSPTDGFVTKVDPSGSSLVYSTYVAGNNFDRSYAIALREAVTGNEVYVTGRTGSTDFVTVNGFAPTKTNLGNRDAYVTRITD